MSLPPGMTMNHVLKRMDKLKLSLKALELQLKKNVNLSGMELFSIVDQQNAIKEESSMLFTAYRQLECKGKKR